MRKLKFFSHFFTLLGLQSKKEISFLYSGFVANPVCETAGIRSITISSNNRGYRTGLPKMAYRKQAANK